MFLFFRKRFCRLDSGLWDKLCADEILRMDERGASVCCIGMESRNRRSPPACIS